jgi:hypothetical protein
LGTFGGTSSRDSQSFNRAGVKGKPIIALLLLTILLILSIQMQFNFGILKALAQADTVGDNKQRKRPCPVN